MGQRLLVVIGIMLMAGLAWAGAAEWKAPASVKATKNPVDKATGLKLGEALFRENCVICHGKAGKGDGEAAAAMKPRPKSLIDRTVQAQTDGELFWKISNGRGPMPPWKHLPEKDRWEMVNYIRTLKK